MVMAKIGTYGHEFQLKVLYSLLNDKPFLQNIADILSADYFDSPAHKWIIDYTLSYYKKYNTHPTVEVLKVEMKKMKNDVLKVAVKEELKQVYQSSEDDIEYVKEEFFNFCKNQSFKEALLKSVDLLENGAFEDIYKMVGDAMKAGQPKDPGILLTKDIESRYREEEMIKIPFPWDKFNEITDGGMPEGCLIIILGGTGSGKSTTACHMALHAASLGFKVAYYTLELSDNYVGKKIDSIMTKIEMKSLKYNRQLIDELNAKIPGQIVIKEFYPGRSTLDNIESHQRHLEHDLGIKTDLIVIDYPELLRSKKTRKDTHEESNDVYTDIKGYAKEYKKRIIAPSQVNRAGMKNDIIEHDGVSGTIGKIFIGDFSFSISRKRKDKLNKTARWHILKSRFGEDGMTYDVHMDLKYNKIDIIGDYDEDNEVDFTNESTKTSLKKKFDLIEQ